MKLADRWAQEGPGGPTCSLGGPTYQGVALCFGDVASGPFQSLPTQVPRWNSIFSFDDQFCLGGFLIKPCQKHRFTKTCGIYQFKPLNIHWWLFLCPYACLIDGLYWLLATVNNSPKLTFCQSLSNTKLSKLNLQFKDFENIEATPQKYTCIQTRILLGYQNKPI